MEKIRGVIVKLEAKLADPQLYSRDPKTFADATALLAKAQTSLLALRIAGWSWKSCARNWAPNAPSASEIPCAQRLRWQRSPATGSRPWGIPVEHLAGHKGAGHGLQHEIGRQRIKTHAARSGNRAIQPRHARDRHRAGLDAPREALRTFLRELLPLAKRRLMQQADLHGGKPRPFAQAVREAVALPPSARRPSKAEGVRSGRKSSVSVTDPFASASRMAAESA